MAARKAKVHAASLLGIDDRLMPGVEDIEKAALAFNPNGGPSAWDDGCRIARQIMQGKRLSLSAFRREFVSGYLNRWRSRFPRESTAQLFKAMKESRPFVRRLPSHLVEIGPDHLKWIRAAFDRIKAVPGAGGTCTAKTLSTMKPAVFVMWDARIAEQYGFAQNANGYSRYMRLMAEISRRLLKQAGSPVSATNARKLEASLKLNRQGRPTPLAKLLDEWNWVTISADNV